MVIRLRGVLLAMCFGVVLPGLAEVNVSAQAAGRERCDDRYNKCTAQASIALEACQETCEKKGDDVCEQCEVAFNQSMKRCDEAYVDCVGE